MCVCVCVCVRARTSTHSLNGKKRLKKTLKKQQQLKMNDSIFLTPPRIWVLCKVGGAGAGGGENGSV